MIFSHCHIKWNKIGSKAEFGGSVASVVSVGQPAMKIATRIVKSVRNHVVHAWHFQCEIRFYGYSTTKGVKVRYGANRFELR